MRPDLSLALCLFAGSFLSAQSPATAGESAPRAEAARAGIAWFGTWQQGLAEARRTGRPILLMAATPHCHNVPGIW